MTSSARKKESWIDCLLAIEDAGLPKQKIPESGLLLAFIMAIRREAEPTEIRALSQLFIEELRKSLADPQTPTTRDIILAAQKAIEDLNEIGKSKEAAQISFSLAMLQTQLAKEVQGN